MIDLVITPIILFIVFVTLLAFFPILTLCPKKVLPPPQIVTSPQPVSVSPSTPQIVPSTVVEEVQINIPHESHLPISIGIDWGYDTIVVSTKTQYYFEPLKLPNYPEELPNVITIDKGEVFPFLKVLGHNDSKMYQHIYCGCENESYDFDNRMYGPLTCQTVVSIMLNFIKEHTKCQVAAIAVRPYPENVAFAQLLIRAGNDVGIRVVIVPMYVGPLTEILFTQNNTTERYIGILDVGIHTTDFCVFSNCNNETKILAIESTSIGNAHLTSLIKSLIQQKVAECDKNGNFDITDDFVLKVKKGFCQEVTTYKSTFETLDESYEVEISYEEYFNAISNEVKALCGFIQTTLNTNLGNRPLDYCEMVGSGWRPFPVLNELKKCIPVQTHLNSNNTNAIGSVLYATLLLDPEWRHIEILKNNKEGMIGGNAFVVESRQTANAFESLVIKKGGFLFNNSVDLTIKDLNYPPEVFEGDLKGFQAFNDQYEKNSKKYSEFLWGKAKLNLNTKKNVLGNDYELYKDELENIEFGDIEKLKHFETRLSTCIEEKKNIKP
ncbi:hypothetical protein EIN_015390 [Entamoeba invadens IP1]|uniref:hypothetical protein n=1 Tax=Entamoeba invadens IP1 TaxID=370355 RepID=UPI0002C3D673|nr:hypothetical protein EIN_015390 [Entamoeba invadens IP1]ELP90380.1 hypothetical protein EIN_015390 [Entamoeba invadens IP1]|eukprot:XP_004257151.1 hypothetical protein EIN_015390 [Entamoeba invadens IP1]